MRSLSHITNLKQLVRITIDDVEAVKKDNKYDFDVGWWHKPNISNGCAVCLAGSIMAKTLGVNVGVNIDPREFDKRTEKLLLLINELRLREEVIDIQSFLIEDSKIEFNLNNLSELNLLNYNLDEGDIGEWERLYNDLK